MLDELEYMIELVKLLLCWNGNGLMLVLLICFGCEIKLVKNEFFMS